MLGSIHLPSSRGLRRALVLFASGATSLVPFACGGTAPLTQIETLAIPSTSPEPSTAAAPTYSARTPKAPPQVDPELRKWVGVWFDPATAYKTRMTIELRGGEPTVVHVEEPIGDKEVYEVRSSTWNAGTLEWSHYVPSTQYTVTYTCSEIRNNALICKWQNDHNASGRQTLPRVGTNPGDVEDDD
jgi:hypothetical protein